MSEDNMIEMNHAIIEQCPDAMIFADLPGEIRLWNAAAERIFGFSKEEALGASLDIIIPEGFREAHWRGFERAIADRVTKYIGQSLPTKSLRADGSTIYVELSFSIVLSSVGYVLGSLSSARDITVRFEKEREYRNRLKDFENDSK
jgi:PAS domain S-box-containing protein